VKFLLRCGADSLHGKVPRQQLAASFPPSTRPLRHPKRKAPPWRELVAPYQAADPRRSIAQLVNTIGPTLLLQTVLTLSVARAMPLWITLALAVATAAFITRVFVLFHDCGHGSFFASTRANEVVGFLTGLLAWAPSHKWWRDHNRHHATAGNLDRRGIGDIDVLTVREYRSRHWLRRLGYRIMRNPLFLFGVGGAYIFLLEHRVWRRGAGARERHAVLGVNLFIVAVAAVVVGTLGWKAWLLTQLLPVYLATISGFWLFYVQHQFADVYWAREGEWNFFDASIRGASHYDLPAPLRWFTGNIGYHHLHHLSSRIPNYRLKACHDDNPSLHAATRLTLATALGSLWLHLYDEDEQRLVGWR